MVTTTTALTVDDLEAMPGDGRRYELIGGAIVMTPAPGPLHQRVAARLWQRLAAGCPPAHEAFVSPIDLDLPGGQRVQPDLVVAPDASVGATRLQAPVVLVVEIVSGGSRTNDLVTKRAAYADAGIPAYWIVDLQDERIECLRLSGRTFEPYASGRAVVVDWPVALRIDLDELTQH